MKNKLRSVIEKKKKEMLYVSDAAGAFYSDFQVIGLSEARKEIDNISIQLLDAILEMLDKEYSDHPVAISKANFLFNFIRDLKQEREEISNSLTQ